MIRRKAALTIAIGLIAVACMVFGSTPAIATDSDREEKWQFYIPITYTSGERFDGEQGSFVDINNDIGWGFAFGYNFTERWMLGFEINWLSANYNGTVTNDSDGNGVPDGPLLPIAGTLDSSSLQIVGQFNFLEKTVTPFIKASLGSTYIDTNIASGPAVGTCYWHPWWGYVCGAWQPTYDANSFSYGAALGLRADIGDAFYLEISYNSLWIDVSKAKSTPSFNGGRLNIGWLF